MSVLVVTGTDTGVGKTIATAALACHAWQAGIDVAVCKPVQTGTADGDDDLAEIGRLSGVRDLHGLARFPEPLAPLAAAQRVGAPLPTRGDLVDSATSVDRPGRLTLVEGAGGLLVEIGSGGVTLRDVARDLAAPVLLVVRPGLGTLNHTALTLEALSTAGLTCAGLVIGSWPDAPNVAELDNRAALDRQAPVRAVLPAGAGTLSAEAFSSVSEAAFDTSWVRALVD